LLTVQHLFPLDHNTLIAGFACLGSFTATLAP